MNKLKCSICGKEYEDIKSYMKCVSTCGDAKLKEMKRAEMEEINKALSKVKAAKEYAEECEAKFKEKYPEHWRMNFGIKENKAPRTERHVLNENPRVIRMSEPTEEDLAKLFDFLTGFQRG